MSRALLLRFSVSLAIGTAICSHGLKRRSLSHSGAMAAFCLGVVHMTCGWTFGLVLICFFASSSKLTKYRQEQKAKLDAHIKPGGQRNAVQVLCNGMAGSTAAVIACCSSLVTAYGSMAGESASFLQLAAWCAFLGHYSCCCADTWASELGMLSRTQPRLITQLHRRVPAGVNGGVTCLGLAASAAGGLCMGAALAAIGWVTGETQPLAGLISRCLEQRGLMLLPDGVQHAMFWMILSLVCGLGGSLMDSVLGATLQYSGYDLDSSKVVAHPGPRVKHISGRPWLSNDAVNAASALLMGLLAAVVGVRMSAGLASSEMLGA